MNGFYEAALAAFRSGDNERARELSEQALSEARASGAAATEVDALCMLARAALRDGAGPVDTLGQERFRAAFEEDAGLTIEEALSGHT